MPFPPPPWVLRPPRACALLAALVLLSPADAPGQEADSAAVRAVADEIIGADNAADLTRVMALYSDTAILLPPDGAPVRGHPAIRPRYASLFREFVPELESEIYEVRATPSFGYVVGRTRGRFRARSGETERLVSDDFLLVAAKESDGRWRIIRLIWNAHPP